MAWIESHQSLRDHPKTLALAAELKTDRVKMIGHLQCLWWWALDVVSEEGVFPPRCSPAVIAQAALWKGNADQFYQALVNSGFIDEEPFASLHDWYEYAGRLVETRKARAEAGRLGGLRSGEARRSIASSKDEANPKQNEAPTNQPTEPTNTTEPDDENLVTERTSISISEALDPHVSRETRSRGNGRALPGDHARVSASELDERRKDEEWLARVDPETIKGTWTPEEIGAGRLDVRSRRLRSETDYVRPQNELPRLREVAG